MGNERFIAISEQARAEVPRQPNDAKGKADYRALLTCLNDLLDRTDGLSISLSELAEAAKVPLSVVETYFSTPEAALAGLAKNYVRQLGRSVGENHAERPGENWEGIVEDVLNRGRDFYNANPVAVKLRLGTGLPAGVRHIYLESLWALAEMLHAEAERIFVLPEKGDLIDELMQAIVISDALWSLSFMQHGNITDEMAENAERAAATYLEPTFGRALKLRKA